MTAKNPTATSTPGLSDGEAEVLFERLQAKLIPLWKSIKGVNPYEQKEQTIVVVPSRTTDAHCHGAEVQAHEERFLCLLFLLRQPRTRLVYVTSQSILPATLDYYLSLLPGVITSHARERFFNVSPEDRSSRPLTIKILERPNISARIRSLIRDPERAHLLSQSVTVHERDLALRLGIPLYGSDPSLFYVESKSGGREVFAKAGVAYLTGADNVRSLDDLTKTLIDMRRENPGLRTAAVQLNGSQDIRARVDLDGLPESGDSSIVEEIGERLRSLQIEPESLDAAQFLKSMADVGSTVEERVEGRESCKPSVQLRISPLGEVEILSTHDQLLGGPGGQTLVGSRFPSRPGYAGLIGGEARKVGERLADMGVLGRIAVDFVVARNEVGGWDCSATDIDLRQDGTTHPFMILQFLTDGTYHDDEGVFRAPSGQEKYYVASDHLESKLYRTFAPTDLFDIVIRYGLHFDQARQTGVLLHMLATIGESGRFGAVAVGNSYEQAQQLFDRIQAVVKDEAKAGTNQARATER